MNNDEILMREALQLARRGMQTGGGPFGAVVARDGVIVAGGMNESRPRNDPTAHAEMMAIRAAGEALGRRNMEDCVLYSDRKSTRLNSSHLVISYAVFCL